MIGELTNRRKTTAIAFRRSPNGSALDMRHYLPDHMVEETSFRLMSATCDGVVTPRDQHISGPAIHINGKVVKFNKK